MFLLHCFYALFVVALRISYVYSPPQVSNLGTLRSYPWSWLGIPAPVVRKWFPYKWFPSVEVWCNRGRCTLSKVLPTFPVAFEVLASCLTTYLLVYLTRKFIDEYRHRRLTAPSKASILPSRHQYQGRTILPHWAFLWGSKDLSAVELDKALDKSVANSVLPGEQETVITHHMPTHVQPHGHLVAPFFRDVEEKISRASHQAALCRIMAPSDVTIEASRLIGLPNEVSIRPVLQPERTLADITILDRSKANSASLSSGCKPVAVAKLPPTKRKNGEPSHVVVALANKPVIGMDTSFPTKQDTKKSSVEKISPPFSLNLDTEPAVLAVNPVSTKGENKERTGAISPPERRAASGTNVPLAKVKTSDSNAQGKSPSTLLPLKTKTLMGVSPSTTSCEIRKPSIQDHGALPQDVKPVSTTQSSSPLRDKISDPETKMTPQSNPPLPRSPVKGEVDGSGVPGKPQPPEDKPIVTAQPSSPAKSETNTHLRGKAKTSPPGGMPIMAPSSSPTKCEMGKSCLQGKSQLTTPSLNVTPSSLKRGIVKLNLQEKCQLIALSTENKLQSTKCEAIETKSEEKPQHIASFPQSQLDAGTKSLLSISPAGVSAVVTKLPPPTKRGPVDRTLSAHSSKTKAVICTKLEATEISSREEPVFASPSTEAEPAVVTKLPSPTQRGGKGTNAPTPIEIEPASIMKHSLTAQLETGGPVLEEKGNLPPPEDKLNTIPDSFSHTNLYAKAAKSSTSVFEPKTPSQTGPGSEKPAVQEKSKSPTPPPETWHITVPRLTPATSGIEGSFSVTLENKPFSTLAPILLKHESGFLEKSTPVMEDKSVSSAICGTKEDAFNEKFNCLPECKDIAVAEAPLPSTKCVTHPPDFEKELLPYFSGSTFPEDSAVQLEQSLPPHVSDAHDPSGTLLHCERIGSISVSMTKPDVIDETLKNSSDSYANIFEEVKEALQNIDRCFRQFESLGLRSTDEDMLPSTASSACQVLIR